MKGDRALVVDSQDLAALAMACAHIVDRHQPAEYSNATGPITCARCSLAGRPVEWPCPDRAAVGTLLPDPSNHMLRHLTGGERS